MKKKGLSFFVVALFCVTTCIAQENLFSWQDGNAIANSDYIVYNTQPSSNRLIEIQKGTEALHMIQIKSKNSTYKCDIKIYGSKGVDEGDSHDYNHFELSENNNRLIYRRGGKYGLTTTRCLSIDPWDNHYFRKIDLDDNSYAFIFAGDYLSMEEILGEMIIVVVNKNVATLVYDGPATAITPTDFDSDSFSMEFVTDGTDLIDPATGLLDITPAKLANRTKYRIYKEGNMLKIASWQ